MRKDPLLFLPTSSLSHQIPPGHREARRAIPPTKKTLPHTDPLENGEEADKRYPKGLETQREPRGVLHWQGEPRTWARSDLEGGFQGYKGQR
ncbi:unnamed protein product [Arctogadus glacialis]